MLSEYINQSIEDNLDNLMQIYFDFYTKIEATDVTLSEKQMKQDIIWRFLHAHVKKNGLGKYIHSQDKP